MIYHGEWCSVGKCIQHLHLFCDNYLKSVNLVPGHLSCIHSMSVEMLEASMIFAITICLVYVQFQVKMVIVLNVLQVSTCVHPYKKLILKLI